MLPQTNEIVFNVDQILHVVTPLITLVGVLLTAAGKAMWKKLNFMQSDIDLLKKNQERMIAQHEINHPGQDI